MTKSVTASIRARILNLIHANMNGMIKHLYIFLLIMFSKHLADNYSDYEIKSRKVKNRHGMYLSTCVLEAQT